MAYSTPPRLTVEEFQAAMSSIWFNSYRFADGRGNLSPEAQIAVLRGARYDSQGPIFKSDMMITEQAMRDLADYLGFDSVIDYNTALMLEKNNIFKRAKTPLPLPPEIPATAEYPFKLLTPDNLGNQ